MPKTRHQTEPTSNRGTIAIMVAGGLLVAALVVWALTRSVEPRSVMSDEPTATTPATTTASYAFDSAGTASTAPTSTVAGQTAPTSTVAGQTPPPPPQPHGDRASVKRIAVEDLRAKVDRNEVTVIDVRDASAYNAAHIPGALNIPFASVESMLDLIPKDKPIVTYCT